MFGIALRVRRRHLHCVTLDGLMLLAKQPLLTFTITIMLVVLSLVGEVKASPFDQITIDKRSRQEAIEAIPFDRLNARTQTKLWEVVSRPSLYRQMPVTVVESDPDMYRFLIRQPEVIVNMWQLMGVTKVKVKRTGDYTFKATDGAGTVCDVQLVYGNQQVHVFYAKGSYDGVLFKQLIGGRCVLVLRSDFARTEDQKVYATSRLDMFVQFDHVGAEILAKTLHPLVGKSADHNFKESTRFLGQVSQAAETRAIGVRQLAERLENIKPSIREEFVKVAEIANRRATLREKGHILWQNGEQAAPGTDAPLDTLGTGTRGANALLYSPTRKPLRLRR